VTTTTSLREFATSTASYEPNRLLAIYLAAAANEFPRDDAALTLLPAPPGLARAAIFATPRHHVVAADVSSTWLEDTLADTLAAAMSPTFLVALERETDLHADSVDIVLATDGLDEASTFEQVDERDHPRLRRARRCRTDIRAFRTEGALVVLGRGAAGRMEIAIELDPAARGQGIARRVLISARNLVEAGEPIFAQVAPGNVAALRAFLAAGFRPIGGEVLFFPHVVGD
jgi:GNAT superfamily N-acetyltransferase